jgi:hypothetical protein
VKVEAAPLLKGQLWRLEMQQRKTMRAVLAGALLVTSTLFSTVGDVALALLGYGEAALIYLLGIAWAEP